MRPFLVIETKAFHRFFHNVMWSAQLEENMFLWRMALKPLDYGNKSSNVRAETAALALLETGRMPQLP